MNASRLIFRHHPLRCTGTDLPPNYLLAAKLMALTVLLYGEIARYPIPNLPLLPILEPFSGSKEFRSVMQIALGVSIASLMLNYRVRTAALICGLLVMSFPWVARTSYLNSRFFFGAMMVFIALYQPITGSLFIRAQFVVMYFGSGLNKLLEPDWHDGRYMHHWLAHILESPLYGVLAPTMPPMSFAMLMGWAVIVGEFALAALMSVPRLTRVAIWVAILLHTGSVLFAGHTFGIFFLVLVAALLTLVDWPGRYGATLRVGPHDAVARAGRHVSDWLWPDRSIRWRARAAGATVLKMNARVYHGIRGFNVAMLLSPVTYVVGFVAIAMATGASLFMLLTFGLVWFAPPTTWFAERLARTLSPRPTC